MPGRPRRRVAADRARHRKHVQPLCPSSLEVVLPREKCTPHYTGIGPLLHCRSLCLSLSLTHSTPLALARSLTHGESSAPSPSAARSDGALLPAANVCSSSESCGKSPFTMSANCKRRLASASTPSNCFAYAFEKTSM